MRYLLDTNVFIAAMKGRPALRPRLECTPSSSLLLSPVVLGELLVGAEKGVDPARTHARFAAIVDGIAVVPIDAQTSLRYGQIRAHLERHGTPIGGNDMWIAAQALVCGAVLVTDNVGEFSRVPDLQWENWLEP